MRKIALALVLTLLLVGCQQDDGLTFDSLPEGDATRGEALFNEETNGTPACKACHSLEDNNLAGPGLAGYGDRAGDRVDGQSAGEYTFYSITSPARHVVDGFSNIMYANYDEKLTAQQIADLSAFLLAQ